MSLFLAQDTGLEVRLTAVGPATAIGQRKIHGLQVTGTSSWGQ